MTAKTRRNKGVTDCTGGLSREQKIRPLLVSSGSNDRKAEGFTMKKAIKKGSSLKKVLKELVKRNALRQVYSDAVEKECVAEEEHYGRLPDRVVSDSTFEEKQFGNLLTPDRVSRDFPCSVVSLALFDGDKMLFACSGIPLPRGRTKLLLTRYVTSARLVREYITNRYRDDKLRIEVRLPNNKKVGGLLELYNHHIAIVTSLGLQSVNPVEIQDSSDGEVDLGAGSLSFDGEMLAAGRAFELGCLMAAEVKLVPCKEHDSSLEYLDRMRVQAVQEHVSSWEPVCSWKPVRGYQDGDPVAVIGGPVIGKDNRIIGMNIDVGDGPVPGTDSTRDNVLFVPLVVLHGYLKHFQILNPKVLNFRGYSLPEGVYTIVPSGFMPTINRIRHLGYPMPPPLMLELNGELLNKFEECFGELRSWKGYPFGNLHYCKEERVWARLGNDVVADISRRVVSIASFHGYERYFPCTGLLIKWHERTVVLTSASLVRSCNNEHEIDNDLRIEVFLPPNQRASGKLELYNLNYNIAIVSVDKKLYATRPEDIFNGVRKSSGKVVAIGRGTQRGLLMGSTGEVKRRDKDCKLDCEDLKLSTCKIKKAGIGGPLINFDGSFVGMNFFDGRSLTPFLPKSKIVQVLRREIKLTLPSERLDYYVPVHIKDAGGKSRKNRWPVPEAYWFHGLLDADMYDLPEHRGRTLQ